MHGVVSAGASLLFIPHSQSQGQLKILMAILPWSALVDVGVNVGCRPEASNMRSGCSRASAVPSGSPSLTLGVTSMTQVHKHSCAQYVFPPQGASWTSPPTPLRSTDMSDKSFI